MEKKQEYVKFIKEHEGMKKTKIWEAFQQNQKEKGKKGFSKSTGLNIINEVMGKKKRGYQSNKIKITNERDSREQHAWRQFIKGSLREDYGEEGKFRYIYRINFTTNFKLFTNRNTFSVFVPSTRNQKEIGFSKIKSEMDNFFKNVYIKILAKYDHTPTKTQLKRIGDIRNQIHKARNFGDLQDALRFVGVRLEDVSKERF